MLLFVTVSFILTIAILTILISYTYGLTMILRMLSTQGRSNTHSICASHLRVVTMCYGTLLFTSWWSKSSYSFDQDKVASVFSTLLTPCRAIGSTAWGTRIRRIPWEKLLALKKSLLLMWDLTWYFYSSKLIFFPLGFNMKLLAT